MKAEHQSIISRIFSDTLTTAEKAEVRQLQANDVSFRKSLELQLHLRQALADERAQSPVADIVQAASASMAEKRPELLKPRRRGLFAASRRAWMSAATVLLLVTVTFGWQERQYSDTAVAERHFVAPPNPRLAGSTVQEDVRLADARRAFFADDYAAARRGYEAVMVERGELPLRARYYLAHASFYLGDYAAAKLRLSELFPADTVGKPEPDDTNVPKLIEILTPSEIQLGRWNLVLTRHALGEDVRPLLGSRVPDDENTRLTRPWPRAWEEPLRKDLDAAWW